MAAEDILIRGGNKLHEEALYYDDGATPLLVASLGSCYVDIIQHGRTLATYQLGVDTTKVYQGSAAHKLIIEISIELSNKFINGLVVCKFRPSIDDATFLTDGEFRAPEYFDLFTVEV